MKSKKIIYLEAVLQWMAVCILKKYKPKVIGITGSVGKTSTKDAVFLALKDNFKVRVSQNSYNNEIGVPLTVIGAKAGGKCLIKWLIVFLKWLGYLILPLRYPRILILEMAVDRPGDMQYLLNFIPVEMAIITDISISHLEFFKNIKQIATEKMKLADSAKKLVIFNADNQIVKKKIEESCYKSIGYGMSNIAEVQATNIRLNYKENNLQGLIFDLNCNGETSTLFLPNVIARHQIYPVLAGFAVANQLKINTGQAIKCLSKYKTPKHRMEVIIGIKGSLVIDDSFNASPVSVLAALKCIQEMKFTKKIVVLGDMLELGKETEKSHLKVIEKVFASKVDILFVVGARMRKAVEIEIKIKKFAGKVKCLNSSKDVSKEIRELVDKDSLILVKGSKAMRMVRVVEDLKKTT